MIQDVPADRTQHQLPHGPLSPSRRHHERAALGLLEEHGVGLTLRYPPLALHRRRELSRPRHSLFDESFGAFPKLLVQLFAPHSGTQHRLGYLPGAYETETGTSQSRLLDPEIERGCCFFRAVQEYADGLHMVSLTLPPAERLGSPVLTRNYAD